MRSSALPRTGPIVVGYDGRAASELALERALREAAARRVDVVVLVVAPLEFEAAGPYDPGMLYVAPVVPIDADGPFAAKPAVDDARRRLDEADVDGSVEWSLGDPAAEILRVATEHHASAIVVGAHHHSALGRLFGADTAADVMRDAPCDVIVAR